MVSHTDGYFFSCTLCSLRDRVVLESNCTEKDYFCCEEMTENNDKKIEVEQANNMTFITHGFRVNMKFMFHF
jgi:hypothetical protein